MDAFVAIPRSNPLIRKLRHGVDLDDGDRALLAGLFRPGRTLEPQQDIVRAGEPAAGVHLVVEASPSATSSSGTDGARSSAC